MSGLLQRLGARATGTAWAVRSDARLPFGAERLADPPVPHDADPSPLAGIAAPPHAHVAAPAATVQAVTRTPARPVEGITRPRADAPRTLDAAAPSAARVPPVHDARVPPQAERPRAADAAALAHAVRHPMATALAAPQPAPGSTAVPAPVLAPPAPAVLRTPAPLLPAQPRSDVRPHAAHNAPTQPFGPPRAPSAAPQETEVHIHIGRIDVTALHEAPRPRARPRERAQPMSLDAYLAQRGTGK